MAILKNTEFFIEVSILTLPHLKFIKLVSVRSVISHLKCITLVFVRLTSLPCINISVRIELTFFFRTTFFYIEFEFLFAWHGLISLFGWIGKWKKRVWAVEVFNVYFACQSKFGYGTKTRVWDGTTSRVETFLVEEIGFRKTCVWPRGRFSLFQVGH